MAHDTREFNQWSFETKALWIGNITVIVLQCSILICPLVLLSTTRRGPNDGIPNLPIFLPSKRSVGGTDGAAGLCGGRRFRRCRRRRYRCQGIVNSGWYGCCPRKRERLRDNRASNTHQDNIGRVCRKE